MATDIPVKSVSTPVDEETGKALLKIEKTLDLKPAVVVRRALKRLIPELLQQCKSGSKTT